MPGSVEPAKNGSGDAWLDCRFAVESVCSICHAGATTLPFLPALESLRIKVIEDLPGADLRSVPSNRDFAALRKCPGFQRKREGLRYLHCLAAGVFTKR